MKYGIHVLALEDTFALQESVRSIQTQIRELGHQSLVVVSVPDRCWSGRVPHPARVWRTMFETGFSCATTMPHDVDTNLPRHDAQAKIRTEAVDYLYKVEGCDRVLIMDPDEWWAPGAFAHLHAVLNAQTFQAYYMRLIPVVGVPGYPIENALDWALVYLAPGVPFKYARAFKKPASIGDADTSLPDQKETCNVVWGEDPIDQPRHIYHFTGTRVDLEEVRRKYRNSSHYREAGYDLDNWMENVLPVIRPGMTDVSFFKHPTMPNFWPRVRDWSLEELLLIPKSLHKFLGTK